MIALASYSAHAKTQVGLVCAVRVDRFGIGQHGPGGRQQAFLWGDRRQHRGEQVLDQGSDVVPMDEGHFKVELGEFGLPVAAQVLIAETARDLEVALQAGHHQQLFELLGRLGQGVELSGMHAGGHQVVARAFGGGFEQDGGFDLDETVLVEVIAHELDHFMAQDQVVLHTLTSQVEVAVFQAHVLVGVFVFVDHERQGFGRVEYFKLVRPPPRSRR